MNIDVTTLRTIIQESVKLGVAEALDTQNATPEFITLNGARKKFGAKWMNTRILNGEIHGQRSGKSKNSRILFALRELRELKAAEEIHVCDLLSK